MGDMLSCSPLRITHIKSTDVSEYRYNYESFCGMFIYLLFINKKL